jgi:hypothetical protein
MNSDPVISGIILSDLVIREWATGKLSLIGCFNLYNVPGFPFQVPPFFVTVMITNIKGKFEKPKTVTVRFEDPSNACVLANMSSQMNAPSDYNFTGVEVLELPFPLFSFFISHAGNYSIDVIIDGEKVGSRKIAVMSTTAQHPPNQKQ